MKIKEAEQICGTLSTPSKMPCHGYSIPATRCHIGKRMRNVEGSICSVCYALKGRYVFPNVKAAMERRYQSLKDPRWVEAMVALIGAKEKSGYFRWHDSGDLQGIWHLANIVEVAKRLPSIEFWLPTREYNIVRDYLYGEGEPFPRNLTVRLSALMLGGQVNDTQNFYGLPTSEAGDEGFSCPASLQGGKCLDCRACWDKNTRTVTYKKH